MPEIETGFLFRELLDGIFVITKEGEIIHTNPAFARMLGYSEEELRGMNLASDIADRQLEWQALTSLLDQGSSVMDYEIKLRRPDGSKTVMSVSATLYRDSRGVPVGIAGIMRDISTRKAVENELREKAFRTDIVNRIAKIAGGGKNLEGMLRGLGDDLRKLVPFEQLSVGSTEEKGRHVEVLSPNPEDPSRARSLGKVPFEGSLVEKLKYGKSAVIVEKDATRKLFSEFALLDSSRMSSLLAVPLKSRGRIVGSLNIAHSKKGEYNWETAETLQTVADQLAGIIDNMMLLKSLENKVRLHEMLLDSGVELQKAITTQQIYAAIASHMKEVVQYCDLSFYLVDWRQRLVYPVYAVGSYTDETMAASGGLDEGIVAYVAKSGKAEFVDDVDADPRGADVPGTPAEHHAMLAIPLVVGGSVLGVLELYRKQGEVFTVGDLEAGLLFAQQASVALSNAQVILRLQEANREIELLNDLMFHDINNYNFATLNYIEKVLSTGDVTGENRDELNKALGLMRQNSKLIENVKKLTKIGVMDVEDFSPFDLCEVLAKTTSALAHSVSNKNVSIKLDLPDSKAIVKANSLIEELFVNLLTNAIKYDPHEEVEIDVACSKVLDEGVVFWKVAIADRGHGIPEEMKHRLFQKYVRLKPETSVSGTGLGLSIVRALTDKFNGRVWVEDRVHGRSDQGATFCVELPAAKDEAQQA
ncbi:MAG: GAF domain-containing protein [Methanobacteriota archaeon]|nr:MAG: GAF domain-containing protein [Euryarchaeota archaeon]